MPSTVVILVILLGFLDSWVGYILNVCIMVSGVKSLKTGPKLNPPDLLHLVIGVVNIALPSLFSIQGLLYIFFIYSVSVREIIVPITVVMLTLVYFTFWLTAWLCIYYCVTSSTFSHPFFVWSKRNISMYLPHLLLLSAVICFFISLPSIWTATLEVTLQSAVNTSLGQIFISGTYHLQPLYIQSASFLGCYVPFLLILASIIVTNSSLIRHLWRIKQKESGLSQTKYQAHINAVRTMWLFLTISIIFCVSEILFFSLSPNPENYLTLVNWLIFMSFPTAESLVITFANPKLRRQIMAKILCFYRKL
ncbi:taste receptor type 2 member 143-like [Ranitomeya imitator]|uniref:taste receptor type 2 member 143-like n=1 Tax=Ranitomeya imitator TaxID=111125 RepID=UPI0037E8962A